jgi:hypothetical protein
MLLIISPQFLYYLFFIKAFLFRFRFVLSLFFDALFQFHGKKQFVFYFRRSSDSSNLRKVKKLRNKEIKSKVEQIFSCLNKKDKLGINILNRW